MALLKITTTPIEYEIKIERAKLKVKENQLDIKERNAVMSQRMNIKTFSSNSAQHSEVNLDSSAAAFQSIAHHRAARQIKATAMNNNVIQNVDPSAVNNNEITSTDINLSEMSAVKSEQNLVDVDDEYDGDVITTSFNLDSSRPDEWNCTKSEMEFVPGRFKMEITQFPEVNVEYTGGFLYVPASADPDYKDNK